MTDSKPPLLIAPPPPGWTSTRPVAARPSGLATASLVLGIASLVLNVLLLPTVLAIVFGAISLARGPRATRAIVGIVLGVAGILVSTVVAVAAYTTLQHAAHDAYQRAIVSTISKDFAQHGTPLTDLECTAPTVMAAGTTAACTAVSEAGTPVRIAVDFVDSHGDFTYRVLQD